MTVDISPGAQQQVAGVFLLDKPAGMTSFAVVRTVRRLLGIKKVGHAGTLDPFATGLLIVCAGRPATRLIDRFMAGTKEYVATLQLGQETETQDPEGRVTSVCPVPDFDDSHIEQVLQGFVGPGLQAPPPFSAAKHRGKPLYHYARQGIMIDKEPKAIEIYSLVRNHYDPQTHRLTVTVTCSRGTYIRVLAADIGRQLECGAHLVALRRIRSGSFLVAGSLPVAELSSGQGRERLLESMLPLESVLQILDQAETALP
ncbi:tRNA pseudouridine(55) synthase TruB [Desulfolithobacter sp.]